MAGNALAVPHGAPATMAKIMLTVSCVAVARQAVGLADNDLAAAEAVAALVSLSLSLRAV